MLTLACVETSSKYWLKSASAVAASDQSPADKRRILASVQAQALDNFVHCERGRVELEQANLPAGVEPCTEHGVSPNNTACLAYGCSIYGEKMLMLPGPIREGQACEVPSTKRPGTCLAGSCVPASAHVQACSAFAMRATALEWLRTLEGERLCQKTGSRVVCSPRPLGSSPRAYFMELLDCESLRGEHAPPATPWGHWPISLVPVKR